jgi:hypothetical protein
MNKPHAATPVAFVRSMLLAYDKAGADPRPALIESQITPSVLRQADGRITASQMETFSGLAMRALDD